MNTVLPIGSVVMLKKGTKPVMIFGYMQKSSLHPGETVDYVGVPYPEGNLHVKAQFGFQMTDIREVLFEGYRAPSFEPWEALLKARAKMHESDKE